AELGGDDGPHRPRGALRALPVPVPEHAQLAHRRNRGETEREALHAAALVIDAHRQFRLPQPGYLVGQREQLLWALIVVREEDDAAGRGVAQPPAIVLGKYGARRIENHRAKRQFYPSHSRITVAEASSRSSVRDR